MLEEDFFEQLPHVGEDVQHRVVFLLGAGRTEVLDDEREEVDVLDEVLGGVRSRGDCGRGLQDLFGEGLADLHDELGLGLAVAQRVDHVGEADDDVFLVADFAEDW